MVFTRDWVVSKVQVKGANKVATESLASHINQKRLRGIALELIYQGATGMVATVGLKVFGHVLAEVSATQASSETGKVLLFGQSMMIINPNTSPPTYSAYGTFLPPLSSYYDLETQQDVNLELDFNITATWGAAGSEGIVNVYLIGEGPNV